MTGREFVEFANGLAEQHGAKKVWVTLLRKGGKGLRRADPVGGGLAQVIVIWS